MCIRCLHTEKKNISECPECQEKEFYTANRFGYISKIPAAADIPCQGCQKTELDLGFRRYQRCTSEVNHVLADYFCKSCRRKKFWSWQLRTLFTGWLGPRGVEDNMGAIVNNASAFFGPPVDLGDAGATGLDQIRSAVANNEAQVAAAQSPAPPQVQPTDQYSTPSQQQAPAVPVVDLSWFRALSKEDQKLITSGQDFYAILELEKSAGHQQVRKAYRELAKRYHPDSGNADDRKIKAINQAHHVLSDYQLRHAFDRVQELPPELRNF